MVSARGLIVKRNNFLSPSIFFYFPPSYLRLNFFIALLELPVGAYVYKKIKRPNNAVMIQKWL